MKRSTGKMLLCLAIFTLSLGLISNVEISVKAESHGFQQFSIQEAINNATSGDTIPVPAGIYQESIIVNKTLTISGANASTTIIQMDNANVVEIVANGVYFSGFTVRNGADGIRVSASNCTITDNVVFNNTIGITLEGSSNNLVSNNTVVDNKRAGIGAGIFLERSANNTVRDNWVLNNGEGIYVRGSDHNILESNFIFNNTKTGICLMNIDSTFSTYYNIIRDNIIKSGSCYGIDFWSVNYNMIFNNTLEKNSMGLSITSSSNNSIFHNNLITNFFQVYSVNSSNIWSDGFEGNYWSNYVGVDLHSGPYQNESSSDGIGDTPFHILRDNPDRYPLMKPYPWAPHDIGITAIVMSKTVIEQGHNASISVIVFNYGSNTENFNTTIYVNATILTTFTNTVLASRNSTIFTFRWNTTGWAYGNYTISAEITQVPNETDTTDNTRSIGTVAVTVQGDFNGDGVVDYGDVELMRQAWQSRQSQPNYNPNLDFNMNGIINIADAAIIGLNWQRHT